MSGLTKIKSVKNAELYENEAGEKYIKLIGVRASYPHLDAPYMNPKDAADPTKKPAYSLTVLLPKTTHVEAKDLCVSVMNELLAQVGVSKISADRKFLRNGDDHKDENYAGHWSASLREARAPTVRDKSNVVLRDAKAIGDLIVAGYWVDVMIRPWFQDGKKTGAGYGERLNCSLIAVRFNREDEIFGKGRIDDSTAWGASSDGDDGMGGHDEDGL